jgi:hypothetical protein
MTDMSIARCAIFPSIGIARVGNSPDGFYIGPEVPGVTPQPNGGYKDAQGRIKRQVARFHLFGFNAAGQVVKELGADDADIVWTVHLANKKAAWYQFWLALDIPEASDPQLPQSQRSRRRNGAHVGPDRAHLIIDPGPRSIQGRNTHGPAHHCDTGTFLGKSVSLGEIRTGSSGNLLVFSGFGNAGTPLSNNPPTQIANNDGWYDDIADGPVTATVTIDGTHLPVDPAWVIVGPPNFAPSTTAIVTLYDVGVQAHRDSHPHEPVGPVSFTRDIYPILARFDGLQWVNEGFYRGYGWKGELPLLDPDRLTQLSRNDDASALARQGIFRRFRAPSETAIEDDAWPRLYGDGFNQPPATPQQYLTVTHEQYRCLHTWAHGHFQADWQPNHTPPQQIADLPLEARPQALTKAALEACSGGPFHPGEEATWPMRRPSMYANFCRLRVRTPGDPAEPDYGDVLTPQRALGPDGPLHRSGPGDITRWMAVPWQTDTANCGSAYPQSTTQPPPLPDLPTFWPAVVPNRVLTQQAYQRIMTGGLNPDELRQAFATRAPWARRLSSDYASRNHQIIADWYRLGFIVEKPGPASGDLPSTMHVETETGFAALPHVQEAHIVSSGPIPDEPENEGATAPPLPDRRNHM